jgi:autotransporter-associated beta strand protein
MGEFVAWSEQRVAPEATAFDRSRYGLGAGRVDVDWGRFTVAANSERVVRVGHVCGFTAPHLHGICGLWVRVATALLVCVLAATFSISSAFAAPTECPDAVDSINTSLNVCYAGPQAGIGDVIQYESATYNGYTLVDPTGKLQVGYGTFNGNSATGALYGGMYASNSGTIQDSGAITQFPSVNNYALWQIANGGVLSVSDGSTYGPFYNYGTFQLTTGAAIAADTLTNYATFQFQDGASATANTLTNSGTFQFQGAGSLVSANTLTNTGTFQFQDGASATANTLTNSGLFQFTGAGSLVSVTNTLTNTGTFQFNGGASATASTLVVNDGKFQFSDSGTSLSITNNIVVGGTNTGTPAFQVAGGATASSSNGIIGDVAGSTGSANIDGSGTSWTLSNQLKVGNSGTGTLTVSSGATVSSGSTCIGCGTGSTGKIIVSGSTPANASPGTATLSPTSISVGQSGTGTLAVANGGIVTVGGGSGTIQVAVNSGSTGTLALAQIDPNNTSNTDPTQTVPTINASTIQFGAGTGTLAFKLAPSTTYTFSPTIAGPGQVAVSSGVIVFNGKAETYTGPTSVSAGATLKLTGGTSIANSLGVNALGTFDISGNGNTSIQSLIGAGGGLVKLGANTLTVTASGSFSGTLGSVGDSGGFTISDSGSPPVQQTLDAVTGNYTGATTINTGDVLVLSNGTNISASSGVVDNGAFDVSGNGNTLIKTLTGGGVVSLGANTLTVSAASGTFSGILGVTSDTGGFTVAGGTQILNGVTGPYSGATTINSGANLTLTGATKIPLSNVVDNGTFDISGNGSTVVQGLTGTNGQVNLGANSLTVVAASGTFSGTLGAGGDTGGFIVGAGTQNFNAVTGNYTGGTTISTGAGLVLTGGTNIGLSSGVTTAGTFDISGNGNTSIKSLTGSVTGQVNLGANTLTLTAASGTVAKGTLGAVGDTGGFTVSAGTETLINATGNYTGLTTVGSGANLKLQGATKILASSGVTDNGTFDISGNGNTSIKTLTGTGGQVNLGAKTLTVTAAAGTFSGTLGKVGDTGGFTVSGGTQTLNGTTGRYSGTTKINAGATLVLSGATDISKSGDVRNNGVFSIGANGNTTITTLSGTTASALVNLDANTLSLSNASSTYAGTIGGTGGLTLVSGTETLKGANTYSGGTSVLAGTIVVGNNSALGTGTVMMAPGTTMSFLGSDFTVANDIQISGDPTFTPPAGTVQTLSGVISDGTSPGTLEMSGAGTLVLSGANTYTGPTNVNSGTLDVTGSIAFSNVTVESGAFLTGTGTVGSTLINSGGTLAPGSGAPGTSLTVAGDLTFHAGANYAVQLNPTSTSFTNVTGNAALFGIVNANFAPDNYVVAQYTILKAATLNGTKFSGVATTNIPDDFTAVLTYTKSLIYLNLLAAQGLINPNNKYTENQASVANALNAYLFSGGVLTPNVAALYGIIGNNLTTALTQLSGEVGADAERGAFSMMNSFLNLMLDPFLDGRDRIGGAAGEAMGFASDRPAFFPHDVALAYGSALKVPPPAPFQARWSVWGAGYGGSNSSSGNAVVGSNDVTTQTYGIVGGMDYHVTPDTVVGFALAGGRTNWDLANVLGSGHGDAFQAGVYSITRNGPAYLSAALGFTNYWMKTNRVAFGDSLTASFEAQSYGGRLEGGFRYAAVPTFGISPYLAVQVQGFHAPAYNETDVTGTGYGLSYDDVYATDTRSEIGARFDDRTVLGDMPLILRARVAWAHDLVSNPAVGAVFETLPGGNFVVNGAPIPQNSALTSAGFELSLSPNLTLLAKFDGEFAAGWQTYTGSGTLRYSW